MPDTFTARESEAKPVTSAHRADRLRRAWALVKSGRVERLGGGRFRVAGNVEECYYVDLAGDPPCTCMDVWYRERSIQGQCKHLLAARLAGLDPALLGVIADWIDTTETDE